MAIKHAVKSAYDKFHKRNWDSIYYLVDLHDTIFESTYDNNELIAIPQAFKVLKELVKLPETKIILWSSVTEESKEIYIRLFEKNSEGKVYAFNKNPDYLDALDKNGQTYASFAEKPYISIIIDDKAGFTKKDWKKLKSAVLKYRIKKDRD